MKELTRFFRELTFHVGLDSGPKHQPINRQDNCHNVTRTNIVVGLVVSSHFHVSGAWAFITLFQVLVGAAVESRSSAVRAMLQYSSSGRATCPSQA